MKTTAYRIWLVLAILELVTLSCGLFTGDRDEEAIEENAVPQTLAEDDVAQEAVPTTQLGGEYRNLEGGYTFD